MTTCGQCVFAKPLTPPNANKRLCYGGPPQVIAIQTVTQEPVLGDGGRVITGNGGKPVMKSKPVIQMSNVHPIVGIADPSCAVFSMATEFSAEVQAIISGNKKAPGDDGREPSMFSD